MVEGRLLRETNLTNTGLNLIQTHNHWTIETHKREGGGDGAGLSLIYPLTHVLAVLLTQTYTIKITHSITDQMK